ncbi:MAG: hypothetical protein JWP01_2253 [Myxococcales bacterium]|nr:hypothetical protein [Myxococcales bacterium]
MHAAITARLRHQTVMKDATFDQVFPPSQRLRSCIHWTPVDVAVRAAVLLAPLPGRKVLDVGAGVGKLCLVGAATTSSTWFGIERDAEMVRSASAAASAMHVEQRTRFFLGDVTSVDWSAFDAFYLFNPFSEMRFEGLLSATPEEAQARRVRHTATVEFVQQQLLSAAAGTRVVTYHGFGGEMPAGFDLAHREPARGDELCLWIRRRSRRQPAGHAVR